MIFIKGLFGRAPKLTPTLGGSLSNGLKNELPTKSTEEKRAPNKEHRGAEANFYREKMSEKIRANF
jgi:hypothetical protein